ncbi:MAG: trigger factor [Gemmatimonadota bacterium]|nr:MAG: trigger factor [Gemmatimonadota bacterium]
MSETTPQTTTNLQISVEEPAAWSRKLVITVPAGQVKSERGKVARGLSKRVRIRGFRKGKVPPERLEAQFGRDIDRQTQQRVIDAAFREAIRVKSLEPISEPRVANVSYDRDSELTFEVAFDIRPEIKLARIGDFRLKRTAVSVSDEEIEARLAELRQQQALWRPVERRATAGDSVEVDITPLGEEEQESRAYRFVLGEGRAIPDVEAAIMTLDPGNSNEFSVRFPDDFADEEQRGKTQRLRIELKQALEQELPPLDDEFATSLGEFADLGELRTALADDIRQHKEQEVELQLDQQIIEQIIAANPFDVPDSMVERYVDALVGAPPEGADPDLVARAREQARPAAEWGIKRTLILQRVAEEQGLESTREEIAERLQALAKRLGRPVQELRGRLAKSGELRDLERRITEEKVFKFLKEQSDIEVSGP